MTRICGKNTALTIYHDGTYTTLPYSGETLREETRGYYTKDTITGKPNRYIATTRTIAGCFVTRLDYECADLLFTLLTGSPCTILADFISKKNMYCNVQIKEFELRADNDSPIYLRCTVKPTPDSYTQDFTPQTPQLYYDQKTRSRTWHYDGHDVTIDRGKWPYLYRFALTREQKEDYTKTTLTIFYPLTIQQKPTLNPVKKITIPLDARTSTTLTITDLVPDNDEVDVESPTEILVHTRYRVCGPITFEMRPFGATERKVVTL